MTPREAAAAVAIDLQAAGVPDAVFEAEYLVRTAAGLTRSAYFAGLLPCQGFADRLSRAVARRLGREPAAYIVEEREFYGRSFTVGPAVLIPRPETELLVVLGLAALDDDPATVVADVGTGSGCVAVSLAAERPGANVVATDVSRDALHVASRNAHLQRASVRFLQGDLATGLRRADAVLANLPYIATHEIDALEPEVSEWEPRVALDGGEDGLELIRRLVADCAERLRPGLLALEVAYGQADAVSRVVATHGVSVERVQDLSGIERVVVARWA